LKDGASSRTKDSLKGIRHVYLDLDEDAQAALLDIRDSLDAPAPNFVLTTSPGKHQVVWKIEGVDTDQAEALLTFTGKSVWRDPAARAQRFVQKSAILIFRGASGESS